MFEFIRRSMTASAVVIAATFQGPAMSATLPQPVSIPVQFVERIKESPDWLATELKEKALGNDWAIENGNLVTANLDVIKYVNRIRAFLRIDSVGREGVPVFVLPLTDGKGNTGTCVTRFPRDVLPKLGVLDFRLDRYEVADLGAEDVRKCLVKGTPQPYDAMDRQTFLSTYFVQGGLLDISKYKGLGDDPDFVNKAYELGFFAFDGDYTGYLQLE